MKEFQNIPDKQNISNEEIWEIVLVSSTYIEFLFKKFWEYCTFDTIWDWFIAKCQKLFSV